MKISVSLVTYNSMSYLELVLPALFGQEGVELEVIVVDNASQDGTVEWIREHFPQVKFVQNKQNVGFAKGHNQGIRYSTAPYVFLLNHDVLLTPRYLVGCARFLETHADAGAVTGTLYRWAFDRNLTTSEKTTAVDTIGLRLLRNGRTVELRQGEELPDAPTRNPAEVFGVSGAAPVYRRAALEDIAWPKSGEVFSEDFFMYKEDVDLAWRLRRLGWTAWWVPAAVGYHDRTAYGGEQMGDWAASARHRGRNPAINALSMRNHLYVLLQDVPLAVWFRYGVFILWYELKKFGYCLLVEQRSLGAYWQAFASLPRLWQRRRWLARRQKVAGKALQKWVA